MEELDLKEYGLNDKKLTKIIRINNECIEIIFEDKKVIIPGVGCGCGNNHYPVLNILKNKEEIEW